MKVEQLIPYVGMIGAVLVIGIILYVLMLTYIALRCRVVVPDGEVHFVHYLSRFLSVGRFNAGDSYVNWPSWSLIKIFSIGKYPANFDFEVKILDLLYESKDNVQFYLNATAQFHFDGPSFEEWGKSKDEIEENARLILRQALYARLKDYSINHITGNPSGVADGIMTSLNWTKSSISTSITELELELPE